ncbi:uncharacterized protein SPPG_02150 [Spizellomyces punctatus DAOM BR117]|uniref:Pectin acetylesterase n=1 Tax=Spizellomyces punctatus (strain DAOM BR117) TaxID=645134 RepID=A0A0L0HNV9_SPIPD|nr:uncharacterized protein SPPG_02150 [Spizellomyces punctatus DAOM BR117]KND03086.1 hypothetical protein SPPG_02150 [Spizellomyces punctatus DAOM BR117]|eukprot:XP_016611125.1 hypothetical protein SPPG_02150 [Spizellomyces punctatus DAOM BR117]
MRYLLVYVASWLILQSGAYAQSGCANKNSLPASIATSRSALCMDGTVPAYYVDGATSDQSRNKWVIFLQGGSFCFTQVQCDVRSRTPLGSSATYSDTTAFNDEVVLGMLSSDPANNDLADWNRVAIPYCSQDLWSGTMQGRNKLGYYAAGHNILNAIFEDLVDKHGFGNAAEVVMAGISAGAVGTMLNVDFFAAKFPNAKFRAIVNAGWFMRVEHFAVLGRYDPNGLLASRPESEADAVSLWNMFVDQECAVSVNGSIFNCVHASALIPHISTPLFIMQDLFDNFQLSDNNVDLSQMSTRPNMKNYVSSFARTMCNEAATTQFRSSHSLFFPACTSHPVPWYKVLVGGKTARQTFAEMQSSNTTLIDNNCGFYSGQSLFNPTCIDDTERTGSIGLASCTRNSARATGSNINVDTTLSFLGGIFSVFALLFT